VHSFNGAKYLLLSEMVFAAEKSRSATCVSTTGRTTLQSSCSLDSFCRQAAGSVTSQHLTLHHPLRH